MIRETFLRRAERDARWKALRAQGIKHVVRFTDHGEGSDILWVVAYPRMHQPIKGGESL